MMNKFLIILIGCGLGVLAIASCKKQSLVTYNAADNIYFNFISDTSPRLYSDTTNVTFSFSSGTVQDTVIKIPVQVTGVASKADRAFEISVDANSTAVATTDYILPSTLLIHAGQTSDSIAITFKRTAAIKDHSVFLALRLQANDQFKTQLQVRSRYANDLFAIQPGDSSQMQTFKVILSDMLQAGPYWLNYSYYFGDFSEKKVRLMNQIIGMPLDFWSVDLYSSQLQQANTLYYGGFTFRYLSDQTYQGNTIFEADGVTPMVMGDYFYY